MRKYILIGLGGFLGAVLRYGITNDRFLRLDFPIKTLMINVLGSFLLGLILSTSFRHSVARSDVRTGVTVGFIGAFTTFSTLSKEIIQLFLAGSYRLAVLYILLSLVLGLGAAACGAYATARISLPATDKDDLIEPQTDGGEIE